MLAAAVSLRRQRRRGLASLSISGVQPPVTQLGAKVTIVVQQLAVEASAYGAVTDSQEAVIAAASTVDAAGISKALAAVTKVVEQAINQTVLELPLQVEVGDVNAFNDTVVRLRVANMLGLPLHAVSLNFGASRRRLNLRTARSRRLVALDFIVIITDEPDVNITSAASVWKSKNLATLSAELGMDVTDAPSPFVATELTVRYITVAKLTVAEPTITLEHTNHPPSMPPAAPPSQPPPTPPPSSPPGLPLISSSVATLPTAGDSAITSNDDVNNITIIIATCVILCPCLLCLLALIFYRKRKRKNMHALTVTSEKSSQDTLTQGEKI